MSKSRFVSCAAIAAALALGGCATATTAYHPLGSDGGYRDEQLDADTFRVEFRSNGVTPRDEVQFLLLLRCAEVTLEAGFDHFIVVEDGVRKLVRSAGLPIRIWSIGDAYAQPSRDSAGTPVERSPKSRSTIESWGSGETLVTYRAEATIDVFRGEPARDGAAAFDARRLVQIIEPAP